MYCWKFAFLKRVHIIPSCLSTYEKYECGELNIKISVLVNLKKIYNCTYDDFFAGLECD